jgi:xylulokinase
MANEPLLVGLDVGTTSIKALIFTPSGKVVAQAHQHTPTYVPQPGWAYYGPEELWQIAAAVLREATSQIEDAGRVQSIAVASMGEAGVPLDAHDQPTYSVIAWYDSRSQPQAAWLEQVIGKDVLYATTGLPLQPAFSLCKLLWLKQNQPEAYGRTVRWLHMADYMAYRLCGVPATDYSLASRTLALDLKGRRWSEAILQTAGIDPKLLAPLCDSGTRLGTVTQEAAQATGLPASAWVASGGHDHVCGALALGVSEPGSMLNSLGTAEVFFVPLEKPLSDPKVGRQGYAQGVHVAARRYYMKSALNTSGACVEWFREHFAGGAGYETLVAEAQAVPPGSLGVTFLPHLHSASPPYEDDFGRGAFIGLSTDVRRGTLFRAILEGLAYDSRRTLEGMLAYPGVTARTLYAIGGSTRNHLFMTIKASVLNSPIIVTDLPDSTCLGAALLGGLGAGVYSETAAAIRSVQREQSTIEPVPELAAYYDAAYRQIYEPLYPTLLELHRAAARLLPNRQ